MIESKRFFALQTDQDGVIRQANRLWRETFKTALSAQDIVHPDDIHLIPSAKNCPESEKPLDITIRVLVGTEQFKSAWYLSRLPSGLIDLTGIVYDIRTLADEELINRTLFQVNHELLAPVCHLKGLVTLLELHPEESYRIKPKIDQVAARIDELVERINSGLG
jgi:hypothetical protein